MHSKTPRIIKAMPEEHSQTWAEKQILITITNLITALQYPHKATPSQELCRLSTCKSGKKIWRNLHPAACRCGQSHLTACTWALPALHPLLIFLWRAQQVAICVVDLNCFTATGVVHRALFLFPKTVVWGTHKALERLRTDICFYVCSKKELTAVKNLTISEFKWVGQYKKSTGDLYSLLPDSTERKNYKSKKDRLIRV